MSTSSIAHIDIRVARVNIILWIARVDISSARNKD